MLITLTCEAPDAPEIGYLLGKNPASVFERAFSGGHIWVFYPEVTGERVTVALLTEIDPVGLVRGPATFMQLDQYVNDRPYVASSLTSVALGAAFSSALAGHSRERPERVGERLRWTLHLPVVACDGGAELIERIFTPLGYTLAIQRLPLDPAFPAWGESDLYDVTLTGDQTTQDALSHLYVLLPVLDNSKHYYVGADESAKLLAHGGAWLASHPERALIARRYLRYKRPLVQSALAHLAEDLAEEGESDAESTAESVTVEQDAGALTGTDAAAPATPANGESADDAATAGIRPAPTAAGQLQQGLHEQRLQAVMEVVRASGAHSLADLGCGEGKLLALALKERSLARIFGMDVSSVALARARRRLRYDDLPPSQRQRIEIAQGSLLYRDKRLENFDVAALVEVIEHLDPPRLRVMEQVVFAHARPRRVVITTPNREYNVHWQALGEERLRHGDHRFEWSRAECEAWATRVASAHGYDYTRSDLGPEETAAERDIGAPSQIVVFDRLDGPVVGDAGEGVGALAVTPESVVDAADAVVRVEGDEA